MFYGRTQVVRSIESHWSFKIDYDNHSFLNPGTGSVQRITKQYVAEDDINDHIFLTPLDSRGTLRLILSMSGGVHARLYAG